MPVHGTGDGAVLQRSLQDGACVGAVSLRARGMHPGIAASVING
jgi:hypothetical protein